MEQLVVTKEELAHLLKTSVCTLVKIRSDKTANFPKPFSLTGKDNGIALWRVKDIEHWIDNRAKQTIQE